MSQNPRYLLSLHEDSQANATLFVDGVPVYAVAEERLTRVKFQGGFPALSMQACLDFAGISLDDVDVILPANRTHFLPRIARDLLPDEEHDYFGGKHKAWLYFQHVLSRGGVLTSLTEQLSRFGAKRRFPQNGKGPTLANFVDHHTAHAYSAYLTSGFEDAVAVTADNFGDGFSSKVFDCHGGRCHYQYGSSARHSPGQFYGEIAQLLGFHNLNAGKVTGLAAHADPAIAYPITEKMFGLDTERRHFTSSDFWWRRRTAPPYSDLARHTPAEIAAAAQRRFEDVMTSYVRQAVRETGRRRVVLAGGCFANVVVNQKILELAEVDAVYVHPAMTDQGISMGAGLCYLAEQGAGVVNAPLATPFLGPGYSEEQLGQALEQSGLRYERPRDLASTAARALAEKRVVARFDGRMEYGPRALGNRSVMYRTDDPSVNDWLNARLARSEFMPFAPVTLEDHAEDRYEGLAGGELAARYMTITFKVKDTLRRESPGVVHLDGTARPQLLRDQDNPGYAAILRRFHELTGVPTVVNTSFNMHGEPIVCSPEDALRCFRLGKLDHLAYGPFWVTLEGQGARARPPASGER